MSRTLAALYFLLTLLPGLAQAQLAAPPVAIAARSWILYDSASSQELASAQPDERVEPASLTKLMTVYLTFAALKQGTLKPEQAIPVSERAWRAPGSRMFIEPNKPVTVNELLHGVIIQSGNDACIALAEILAGQPEVEPGRLDLELRETRALKDLASVCAIITACRKIGVSFALDDFACGHSSLTYLKSLPVSRINIDRSFVCDLFEGGENRAILEGVIGLATAFRRQIVAEGVENVEQGRMLLQLGCENVQGDGIARPMPAADLVAWVVAWQREAGVAKPASPRTLATTDPS